MTLPWRRLSELLLSQGGSARISPLSGTVENSTLSLQALWRSHLSWWSAHPMLCGKGLASKLDMWSTLVWDSGHGTFFWRGIWWVFLRVTVQLGLGFGTSSHELDCDSHALQGLGFGFSRGACTCLQGLTLFRSAAPWIMEFYWCGSEAWGDLPHPFFHACIYPSIYSAVI